MKFLLAAIAAILVPVAALMAFLRQWDELRALGFVVVATALLVGAARFWRSFLLQPPRWMAPLTRFPWVWALAGVLLLGMGARAAVLRDWLGVAGYWGVPVGVAALVMLLLYVRALWWRANRPPKHPDHDLAMRIVWNEFLKRTDVPPSVTYRWGIEWFWAPMVPYGWRKVYGLTTSRSHCIVAVKDKGVKLSETAFPHEVVWHCAHGDWGHARKELDVLTEQARAALIEAGL